MKVPAQGPGRGLWSVSVQTECRILLSHACLCLPAYVLPTYSLPLPAYILTAGAYVLLIAVPPVHMYVCPLGIPMCSHYSCTTITLTVKSTTFICQSQAKEWAGRR